MKERQPAETGAPTAGGSGSERQRADQHAQVADAAAISGGSMNDLERRYRNLLAWYPWEHRRQYEDEMAETLVAGAKPGQRRPSVLVTADIARTAAAARVRYAVRELAGHHWADACAVTGLLAAIVVLSLRTRSVAGYAAAELVGVPAYFLIDIAGLVPIAIWLAVVVFAVAGMRRTSATAAWSGVAFDFAITMYQPDFPTVRGYSIWPFLLAMVAAAALTVRSAPRRGARLLGGRRLTLVGLGCVAGLAGASGGALLNQYSRWGSWDFSAAMADTRLNGVSLAGGVIALASAGIAVWTLGPALRRRIVALFAPPLALFAAVQVGSTYQYQPGISYMYPEPVQWLGAAMIIPVTLVAAVLFVQRRERRLRLIELGRAADRPVATTPAD
jgi:hypothetical protein